MGRDSKTGIEWDGKTVSNTCFVGYVPLGGTGECVSGDKGCFGYNKYEMCISCYSTCDASYEEQYTSWCSTNCDSCQSCDAKQSYGTESTKQGCTSAYGVCSGCDACQSCQGCESCQSLDKAEDAQSSLIKNVDESVTRRARGEGYSKAAANMIGGGSAQDATAENFNDLAMQQNQAATTTQADWLNKQGYLDALDQEIRNKEKGAAYEKAGAFFNF